MKTRFKFLNLKLNQFKDVSSFFEVSRLIKIFKNFFVKFKLQINFEWIYWKCQTEKLFFEKNFNQNVLIKIVKTETVQNCQNLSSVSNCFEQKLQPESVHAPVWQ